MGKKVFCPNCKKELNEYEVSKLWCTECNSKFKSLQDLMNVNKKLNEEYETNQKLLNEFLIITGDHFDRYEIDTYFKLLNSEIVMGTGLLSEWSAQINDTFGTVSETFGNKLQQSKELAMQKIIDSAIKIGANALLGFRFEMFSLTNNILAVSAYGTAVHIIEKSF